MNEVSVKVTTFDGKRYDEKVYVGVDFTDCVLKADFAAGQTTAEIVSAVLVEDGE